MAKYRILLLIFALSAIIEIGNCSFNEAIQILREAGEIAYTMTVKYEPENISLSKTIQQLKKVHEQSNIKILEEGNKKDLDDYIPLNELSNAISKKLNIDTMINSLSIIFCLLNQYYNEFEKHVQSFNSSTKMSELDEYFERIVKLPESIESYLEQINKLSTEKLWDSSSSFFEIMERHIREFKGGVCDEGRLTQGHIWNYFYTIFELELKGSLIITAAYRHLTMRKKANYKFEISEAQQNAKTRFRKYLKSARKAMRDAPREILTCDDGRYIKNKTYTELQGITQGFIIDPDAISNAQDCNVNEPRIDFCDRNSEICFHRQCSELGGEVNQCRDLTEGKNPRKLSICPSEDNEKRYSWAELDGTSFGNNSLKKSCSKSLTNYGMVGTESHGFLFFSWSKEVEKKMCFCNCERIKWKPGDVRGISWLWTEADYKNNSVITDIRFEEKHGMIHLGLQQGRLLPGGRINQSSLSWIKNPDVVPSKNGNNNKPIYSFYDEKIMTVWVSENNFLYVSNNLSINLDDLIAPKNHVIIGAGFREVSSATPFLQKIQLMIASIECDFRTGTLSGELNFLTGSQDRQFLDLGSPGNPAKMKKLNNDISQSHTTVQFQQTDWKKDLGQSIVPFFDKRPVKPQIALPLSGISLYHRGCKDCGGFLSFMLTTADFHENIGYFSSEYIIFDEI